MFSHKKEIAVIILILFALMGCLGGSSDDNDTNGDTTPDDNTIESTTISIGEEYEKTEVPGGEEILYELTVTTDDSYNIYVSDPDYYFYVELYDSNMEYITDISTNSNEEIFVPEENGTIYLKIYSESDSDEYDDYSGTFMVKVTTGNWVNITDTPFTDLSGQEVDIEIDSNDNLYLSYGSLSSDTINIHKYDGTWSSIDSSSISNYSSKLDLEVADNLFLSYIGTDDKVWLANYNGSWSSNSTTAALVYMTDIELSNEIPYLLYSDQESLLTWYPTVKSGTSLDSVGARYLDGTFPEDVSYSESILELEVFANDIYLLAARDTSSNTPNNSTLDILKYNGSWEILEETFLDTDFYYSPNGIDATIDSQGNLVVAYLKKIQYDNDYHTNVKVYDSDNATWSAITTDFASKDEYYSSGVKIINGNDGNLYLLDFSNYDWGTSYVYKIVGSDLEMIGNGATGLGNYGVDIAVDSNGVVYMTDASGEGEVEVYAFK